VKPLAGRDSTTTFPEPATPLPDPDEVVVVDVVPPWTVTVVVVTFADPPDPETATELDDEFDVVDPDVAAARIEAVGEATTSEGGAAGAAVAVGPAVAAPAVTPPVAVPVPPHALTVSEIAATSPITFMTKT